MTNLIKGGYVYILTSSRNGTLYIGVTSNLVGRIDQHKKKQLMASLKNIA